MSYSLSFSNEEATGKYTYSISIGALTIQHVIVFIFPFMGWFFFKVIFPHFVAIVDPSMNKGRIGCFNNCNLSLPSNTEVLVCVT